MITRAIASMVITDIDIRKRSIAPNQLERLGCPSPPRLYNEVKYEGLPEIAQPSRMPLLHTKLDGSGSEKREPPKGRLHYVTGS